MCIYTMTKSTNELNDAYAIIFWLQIGSLILFAFVTTTLKRYKTISNASEFPQVYKVWVCQIISKLNRRASLLRKLMAKYFAVATAAG